MSETAQRVVVIQDASRNISSEVLRGALQTLQLKPGDELTLLGVLHQVNTPSTFSFMGGKILMGYKSKVDSNSFVGANKKSIMEAIGKKIEEYRNSRELLQIRNMYKMHKINFSVKLVAAPSPKIAALETAQRLEATWIILDRQMKKDKKFFLEKLSCGISKMKRDDSVEKLRGPKDTCQMMTAVGSRNSLVTYDEMIPGPVTATTTTSGVKISEIQDTDQLKIPETTDASKVKIPETIEDDDCFSLELFPTHIRSPSKNSPVEEPREDDEKVPPWRNIKSLLHKIISSEHLNSLITNILNVEATSSPRTGLDEAPSTSNFAGAKHLPLRKQEEKSPTDNKTAVTDDRLPITLPASRELGQADANKMLFQDPGQRQTCVDDNDSLMEPTEWHPEERLENSFCPKCHNERPVIGWTSDTFTYDELEEATDKFSDKNFLSEGGFGSVYKGKLKNGIMIAVKQHKDASSQGEKEFKAEVDVLSKARHRNVVMLLGSCSQENHRLLVYEFVCNGSLDRHLSRSSTKTLSWSDRMKIALGAARGLNYLHENYIIHRDMRPNNILVTHDYEPMLGDFGLAKTQREGSDHSSDNQVVGTLGYLAPEYAESGKVSKKTDVYSFGVVLLELITGRSPIDRTLGEKSLIGWARPLLKERKYPDLIDSRILDSHDVLQLFWMVRVAEKCLYKDPDKRISMNTVVEALECITNRETVTCIEEISPAHIPSSMPESSESQRDNETVAKGRLSAEESPTSGRPSTEAPSTSSWSRLSEAFSTASSTKTSTTRSSIRSKSSDGSIASGYRSYKKKRSKSGILYNEMLDD